MTLLNPHQHFRRRLLAGELLLGTFVKTPSMQVAELLAQTELDVLCFDAEHAAYDRRDLDAAILACRSACQPALVRIPKHGDEHILNALDCGATGVLIPHVDSAAQAAAAVACSHFGASGRSYAGSTRAAGYGAATIAENQQLNREETTVIVQIEDLSALECIDAIAATDGIDCLFIGLMDITVALGAESVKDAVVEEAIESVCASARSARRKLGIFTPLLSDIPLWVERGINLFLLASDQQFLQQGAKQLKQTFREAAAPNFEA